MSAEIPVRFVLAGSCHPFSGRQVLYDVPSNLSLAAMLSTCVFPDWPSELEELRAKLSLTSLKILKNGRNLDLSVPLSSVLTSDEQHRVSVRFSNAEQRASDAILLHLAFIPQPSKKELQPPTAAADTAHVVQCSSTTNSQEKRDVGCCSLM